MPKGRQGQKHPQASSSASSASPNEPPLSRRNPAQMTAWLDENCGANGWAMRPSGTRGVLNECAIDLFSRKRHLRVRSWRDGASGAGSRRPEACFRSEMTSQSRGSGPGCIEYRERRGRPLERPSKTPWGRDRRVPWCGAGPAARIPTPTAGAAHARALRRGVLPPTGPVREHR
jgi:hypothetical protein